MGSTDGKREYIAHRVLTASPVELIQILYQSAVQAVDEAVAALQTGDILGRGRAVTKAIEILSELQASLRRDVQEEYSNTLGGLYAYMQEQLIRAHREKSETILLEVWRLLNTLLDGWSGAMSQLGHGNDREAMSQIPMPMEAVNASSPYAPPPVDSSPQNRCWQV